jgi:hypothetical protein
MLHGVIFISVFDFSETPSGRRAIILDADVPKKIDNPNIVRAVLERRYCYVMDSSWKKMFSNPL